MATIKWTQVQQMAKALRTQNSQLTQSEAFRLAWANLKLQNALKTSICSFTYTKCNGETRTAFGTLRPDIAEIPEHNPQQGMAMDYNVQKYYDTEKRAWRCFKRINLCAE